MTKFITKEDVLKNLNTIFNTHSAGANTEQDVNIARFAKDTIEKIKANDTPVCQGYKGQLTESFEAWKDSVKGENLNITKTLADHYALTALSATLKLD